MTKIHTKKFNKLILCLFATFTAGTLVTAGFSNNYRNVEAASRNSEAHFYVEPSSCTELEKTKASVAITGSAKTDLGQSVQFSFATGYSSFAVKMISCRATIGPNLSGSTGAAFQEFYFDGSDGAIAFSELEKDEDLINERTAELKTNPSDNVSVYDGFVQSLSIIDNPYSNKGKLFVPKRVYRVAEGEPYKEYAERKEMTNDQLATPVLTLEGDNIYCMDSVVYFGIVPREISSHALDKTYSDIIKEIYIPSTVDTIHADSFFYNDGTDDVGPASDCVFYTEMSEAEIHALEDAGTFEAGWNGGLTVNYGFDYKGTYEMDLDATIAEETPINVQQNQRVEKRTISFPGCSKGDVIDINQDPDMQNDNNYYLGWYSDSEYHPLTALFNVTDSSNTVIGTTTYNFPEVPGGYSVGSQIYRFTTSLYADMDFENLEVKLSSDPSNPVPFNIETMVIDPKTCVLMNIFHASKASGGGFTPDLDTVYKVSTTDSLKVNFNKIMNVDDFISLQYTGLSTFAGFTAVDLKINKGRSDLYQELMPSSYRKYQSKIQSGEVYIRYRFDSLKQSYFRIKLKGLSEMFTVKVATPIKQFEVNRSSGNYSFMFKNEEVGNGFAPEKIERIDLLSTYISIDLAEKIGPVARTGVSTRFGVLPVIYEGEQGSRFNGDSFVIVFTSIFVASYVALATALFFYWKVKFKNDEFRRLKPKAFIKSALIGLVSLTTIALAIVFLVFRTTLFNNAIVVYNPVDPFVIGFGIVSIIIIGYLVKFAVTQIKAMNTRRRAAKLKLDQDVDNDGTN